MALQTKASRHHPALVALHWLLALMLMVALAMGTFVLSAIPLASPEKMGALRGHLKFDTSPAIFRPPADFI